LLKRLRLRNFYSFRDTAVELDKVNVLVGLNASGKSNFVKVLRLLRNHFTYGLPVPDESKPEEIPFGDIVYGFNIYETAECEASLELSGREVVYKLRLLRDRYEERVAADSEALYEFTAQVGQVGVAVSSTGRYRDGSGMFKPATSPGLRKVVAIFRDLEGGVNRVEGYAPISPLSNPPGDADPSIHSVVEFFRGIGVFKFSPDSIRLRSSVSESPIVKFDGSNLARYLLHLYLEKRRAFSMVEDVIRSFVPEVEEVIPHIEGSEVEIWVRSRYLRLPLRPSYISDGTLRLIALTVVLNAGFSLVAIEEPENHIHPYLLESLVDMARKSRSQVVITTHSPHLLNFLKPEEVYVVARVNGESKIARLTDTSEFEIVKKYLEEGGTLGEAWVSRFFS